MNDLKRRRISRAICAGASGGVKRPPNLDEAIQWIQSNDVNGPIEILTAPTVDEPVYNDVPVLSSDGTAVISSAHILGTETVTNAGTASVVVGVGTLTFGVGTVYGIEIDGVLTYPVTENNGTVVEDVSVTGGVANGNDGTISGGATWTTADGIPCDLAEYGCTPSVVSDGSQCGTVGLLDDENTKVRIKFINKDESGSSTMLFGSFNGGNSRFAFGTSPTGFLYWWGNLSAQVVAPRDTGVIHEITLENNKITFDGVETPFSGAFSGATLSDTSGLFCSMWNGADSFFADCEILSYERWQSGTPVRDMIPINDGQFYDKVSYNTFGADTGTLVTKYTPALRETVGGAWLDAEGNPLGVKGSVQLGTKGPLWQQSAPYTIIQTDADFTVFGGANFWGDGSTVWNAKSYTDADTFVNGTTGNWFKCYTANTGANGEKIIAEALSYLFNQTYTPEEYNQILRWLGSCELTGGTLIPYPVTAGTGIGPNGEWYTPDGTHVYLVEDL